MSDTRFDLVRDREGPRVHMHVYPSEADTAASINFEVFGMDIHMFFSANEARQLSEFFAAAAVELEGVPA